MKVMIEPIKVEIIYARPDDQVLKSLLVPAATTVEQAITLSGITDLFPEIDLKKNRIGIFSKFAKPETILRHHDRIEIYRPLIIDPKEARRKRAAM
jgi:putative ubiquitin-RnfH superfamily antitoxin RatB of RatAB toxin-antitoxin module